MKLFFNLLLAAMFILLPSCSEKNQEEMSLVLKSDLQTIPNDGESKVVFTVLADKEDVTDDALIYLSVGDNLQIVEGNRFSSKIPGDYEFYAVFSGKESNRITITVGNEFTSVRLEASSYSIPDDGVTSAEFTVYDNDEDVTADSDIYQVVDGNRSLLQGRTFSSAQEGIFQFIAVHEGMESEPVFVSVESPDTFELPADSNQASTDFYSRVMVLKNTGTSCAYCPLVSAAIKEVMKDEAYNSRMGVVEVHNFNEDDPMMNQVGIRIRDAFNVNGWPLVIYNMRGDVTSASEGGNDMTPEENMEINISTVKDLIDNQLVESADAAISAVSKIEGNEIKIKASVKSGKTAEYHLGVFLLEDNIKAPQNEYGPDTEAYPDDFDANKHMNVLRATSDGVDPATFDVYGQNLGSIESGSSIPVEMSITLDKKWVVDNCHLLFYVCAEDGETLVVKNVVRSEIGQKIPYRYN